MALFLPALFAGFLCWALCWPFMLARSAPGILVNSELPLPRSPGVNQGTPLWHIGCYYLGTGCKPATDKQVSVMSLPSIAGNALRISRILTLSAVCCGSAVLADPSTAPFTYNHESISEQTAPEAESEPELANALPLITCLLYTSPSPRDATLSRMPSSA